MNRLVASGGMIELHPGDLFGVEGPAFGHMTQYAVNNKSSSAVVATCSASMLHALMIEEPDLFNVIAPRILEASYQLALEVAKVTMQVRQNRLFCWLFEHH